MLTARRPQAIEAQRILQDDTRQEYYPLLQGEPEKTYITIESAEVASELARLVRRHAEDKSKVRIIPLEEGGHRVYAPEVAFNKARQSILTAGEVPPPSAGELLDELLEHLRPLKEKYNEQREGHIAAAAHAIGQTSYSYLEGHQSTKRHHLQEERTHGGLSYDDKEALHQLFERSMIFDQDQAAANRDWSFVESIKNGPKAFEDLWRRKNVKLLEALAPDYPRISPWQPMPEALIELATALKSDIERRENTNPQNQKKYRLLFDKNGGPMKKYFALDTGARPLPEIAFHEARKVAIMAIQERHASENYEKFMGEVENSRSQIDDASTEVVDSFLRRLTESMKKDGGKKTL